jgi:hypothetical protein
LLLLELYTIQPSTPRKSFLGVELFPSLQNNTDKKGSQESLSSIFDGVFADPGTQVFFITNGSPRTPDGKVTYSPEHKLASRKVSKTSILYSLKNENLRFPASTNKQDAGELLYSSASCLFVLSLPQNPPAMLKTKSSI